MTHLQYMPGDPRLVDQLVYELKSKGIFDQFRKDCIADVDTRPAYQNLRQRVESSVSTFLSRQCWKPDLNKNQIREKLRKHILDGNYLEQGVERIVDQVVNPKVASIFIPQVEDLVYNYLGIARKKSVVAEETTNGTVDLLPTDLEAVSPGSVKSDDKEEGKKEETPMEVNDDDSKDIKEESMTNDIEMEKETKDSVNSVIEIKSDLEVSMDSSIPLPTGEINPEDIVTPENSPTKEIRLPNEITPSDIPLPEEIPKTEKELYFKTITSDDESSSDSSLRRNMSPLTPVRNFDNENSCDAQQGFDDIVETKEEKNLSSPFKFAIENKSSDNSDVKIEKKEEQTQLSYQFNNQININTYNMYEESSNSNNLLIDYESDANSKTNPDAKIPDVEQGDDKKDKKSEEKKSSHKSSHRSRDSHRHSSSKDKRSDSKHSSRDSSKHDKKSSSKDDSKTKSSEKDKSKDRSEKKDSKDSSRHRSSHKSSRRDSKSHRSSSSSQKHSSKHSDDRKSSSSKDKLEKSSDKSSKEKSSRDSKSSSHRSDKDRKSNKKDDKDKKDKKDTDDHYSLSGRNNNNRRSTDRDSNDGSSSSKGSHNPSSKTSDAKKDSKSSSSKSEPTSNSSDNTSPSDKEKGVTENKGTKCATQSKPVVRVDTHLETPFASPPRLPFVPDVTIKKPKYAANMEEAKKLMKMRRFMEDEQKRMNQEAALLLEFQANVRPSLSQVYSSIPGPELEFACVQNSSERNQEIVEEPTDSITQALTEMHEASDIQNIPTEYLDQVNNTSIEAQLTGIDDIIGVPKNVTAGDIIIESTEEEIERQEVTSNESLRQDLEIKEANLLVNLYDITSENIVSKETENIDIELKEKTTLQYFSEHEKTNAELERDRFNKFFKSFTERMLNNKMYLINCKTYEENIIKEAAESFGNYEIVNYIRNGHLKLSKPKNVVNVYVNTEMNLPLDETQIPNSSTVFSPRKECSFDLSSEYDSKMEEAMSKKSRQQIMEIILGNAAFDMPTTIDYCNESNIDDSNSLKRKADDVECANNNSTILTPNKIRKLSESDVISSTTEEIVVPLNNNQIQNNFRSKYLGKARRVGLSRPKKILLPNSPSSDKSVENYENPTGIQPTPNGKLKTPRSKVQRYATSDLYKPKLHYLSRRNNIT